MASKFDDLMRQYGVTPPQNTKQSTTYIPAGYTGGAGNKGSGSAELDALMRKYYVDPTPGMRTRLTDEYMAAVGELNRRRREEREAQYAPAVRTNTDLTKPGTAAGRDFVAMIGGKEPAKSTGKGRDSVVLIGGKGSADTKEDTTKGRGSRSYLREGMLYGKEAPEQATTSAVYAQAQQDYQKALDTYRRVSAVSGPVSPQKQKEIDDARRAMEAAKQRADAAQLPDQSGWSRFVDNLQNIGEAAVTGMAAAYSGAERVLFEAGQSGRTALYQEEADEARRNLEQAQRDLEQAKANGFSERDIASIQNRIDTWQQRYDALTYVTDNEVQQQATQATTELTQQLEAQSQKATEAAKEQAGKDMGRFGAFAVDVAVNMLQMGGDAGVALATGGSSLIPMGFRVFGQSASEAQQAGASLGQQIGYGAVAAGIELLTEKLFDGVAGIYGPGEADDISEAVVRRLASTPEGQNALRLFLGMNEEGLEEVISDILSPAAKTIYTGQSLAESYSENLNPADVLYDYLVGAAAAGGQTAVNTVNPINSTVNQYREANAENARMTELYTELGEKPGILREARDRGILRAVEAGEKLSAKDQERAEKLRQTEQKIESRKNAGPILVSTFNSSGIELNETQQETLTQLAQEGDAGTKDTVLGMRDAYRLGQQGKTLEETTLAVEDRGLTPKQISRAWGFGASTEATEAETADVNTEEGKTRLEAALAALGARTEEAAKAYDPRQDVGRYSAAMQKAAFLYAANGADLTQIVQDARDGKTADIVGYLTDEQVQLAEKIGQEQRQQVREAEKAMSESLAALRQQAAALTAGQTVTAQALAETETAIDVANRASQRAVNAINQTYDRLPAMVKANPNAENTEAYKQAYDEAMQQKKKIEGLQRTVRELTRKKAELEGKKTIKRKKGTISYAGGTVEGVKYDGVDPAKLTRQQKKVTAMVESLADAVNLDYVFISADPGMGGAYVKGGTIYVNINAGMGVGGFSQTMAAASLSHELTHWMQDYAPEQYRDLKDFIISEILKADPQELRRLVEQQRRWEQGRSLSYEQALDEVVANACQTMLLDSKAITKLARQNMTLAERIRDFIEDWTTQIKEAFAEVDTSQGAIYDSLRAVEGSLEHIQELWDKGIEGAAANYNAEKTVASSLNADSAAEAIDAAEQAGVQYSRFVEDENTLHFLDEQEKAGKVVHTYKSFLEIDGKLYPPMASMQKDENGKWKMAHAMEVGRWEESIGDPSKIIIDPKTGKGYYKLKKDNGSDIRAAYNPYQHSSNLMLNDQFSSAYQRPNIVTYECIIPESELTSGYRAEYAKDAVGLHPWKAGIVAGKIAKAKGIERQVYLSRWLKPVRKVPEAEVAQHYKELLDGTYIAVPSNVVTPALLEALEDAGVKIEYTEEAPKNAAQNIGGVQYMAWEQEEILHLKEQINSRQEDLQRMNPVITLTSEIQFDKDNVYAAVEWVKDKLGLPRRVNREGFGSVLLDRKRINRGFNYRPSARNAEIENRLGQAYTTACAAIPDVIERGIEIEHHKNHKGRGYPTWTYAAPVVIDGERGNLAVVVKRTTDNYYDVHSILTPDGNLLILDRNNKAEASDGGASEIKEDVAPSMLSADSSIADSATESKTKNQTQFQMISDVEETPRLVAVHNKSVSGLRRMLQRGGVPFPSIAIKKAGTSHEGFGDVSIVFPRSTIDPAESRWNRLYSNDAWTPTEPRTEYEADEKITSKVKKDVEKLVGSTAYNALNGSSYLHSSQIERALLDSNGDVFNAFKSLSVVKYAYLKSKGQDVELPTREKPLDGSYRYQNSQFKAIFDEIDGERLATAKYDDMELAGEIADILNRQYEQQLQNSTSRNKDKLLAAIRRKPLYSGDDINLSTIRYAYETYQRDGGKFVTETDSRELDNVLRNNKAVESDPEYKAWIEQTFQGVVKNEGIPNGKDLYTDSGNMRSFKARHVPATLENIVQQMRKENERGNGLFGVNLRGAATKAYSSVEEMRQDAGKLLGTHVSDEVYDGIMEGFHNRLHEMASAATKYPDRMSSYDTARDVLLEAVRDAKSKASMARMLQKESDYIKYTPELADELWTLRNDVQNMPAPYFEAKPRRIVYPEEALAYILPDNADSDVMKALEDRGYNVLTYKAGDEADRLRKLNSVEGAQFQRWDDTDVDTAAEANGREQAYAQIESENAVLKETVAALRKLTDKQSGTIAKLQKRLQITKTPEVREGDSKRMAGQLVREYGSRADRERIAGELKALGDYILQTDAAQLSEDEIKNRARQIAVEILDDAREQYAIEDENLAGIAKSIKGRKLTIDPAFLGELDQAGGFDALRKRNFGLFTLAKADSTTIDRSEYTSVSQFYSDLQSEYGKGYFPDLANEGEELLAIAENARAAAPMEVNPYEQYMGETVEHLSNQIAMDALGGVLRAEAPKYADVEYRKEKSRNAELNEHIKKLAEENKITKEEAGRLWSQVQELATKLDHAEMQYAALEKAAEDRIAQVRAEGSARRRQIKAMKKRRELDKIRATKKIEALKEYYRRMEQNAKEMRENAANSAKYRKQIEKKVKKLQDMLIKNDDKTHVPEVLKAPLGDFLAAINMDSKSLLNQDISTEADSKRHAAFLRMLEALQGQQDYIDGNGEVRDDFGGYLDISQDNLEFLRNTASMIYQSMSEGSEYTINRMNTEQLKDLSNFLSNLTKAINDMNRFMANARFESVREAASQDIETIKELGRAKEFDTGKIMDAAAWENGTPYYVFRRFGEGGKAIFDSFTRGWEKMAFNVQKIMDFTKKTYSDKEVRDWQQERHEIELEDGSKVTMTTGQIMSMSMLLNREQARKHMEKGGVRIGDIESKKGVIKDITHYHLTEADIQNILGQLTDRQVEVAQALQRFMAEQGAEWGNEISMRRFGYNFYTEGENYFPITTDSTDRPMSDTDAQQNSMFRLLNLSASKALNPKASNALVVNDIFDVFADHMADMAKLNGMGLPILDAIKWFNFKERIDLGDGQYDTRTMQAAIEQAFGDKALSYFRTLMKDINGVTESGDRGTGLLSKLMSNYKAASVAANLRVAFLQPTSYVRASYLIKPKYLTQAFTSHNAYKEAMEYSGTAVWKSLGYYDTNIARGMRDQIKHNESWKDKAVDKSMKLAEFWDQRTWGRLWVACKLQTAAETGLQGEELKQKTADLFREVIYSSQVMDATLTRSELMRGKTLYSKTMTAFMAEPTLSYNMVMDAGMEYYLNVRRNGKAQAWQESKGNVAKAFTVYACSAAFSAIVESIFDALRDDDDMESFFEKWRQAMFGEGNVFGGNLVQDLTIFGKLPYVKSFMSTLQGYKNKDMSNAAFEDALTAFKIWKETIDLATGKLEKPTKTTYYGNMTQWGKLYKSLQALSELSGLGVANLTRDVLAVWNTAMEFTNHQELKVRTYESSGDRKRREAITALTQQGIPRSLAQQAMQEPDENGDGSLRQEELGTWLTEKIRSGEITEDQADAIWETQGWKTERRKWSDSQEKKEAKAKWQDVFDAADAAGDGNGSVKQEELAAYLTGEIKAGRLTEAEAEEAWKAAGPTWKKSYAQYVKGK